MKSRIVPLAGGLMLCGVSVIATAQPQTLSTPQLDGIAAGALPTLSFAGLGDVTAGLSARLSAARDAAAGIQASLRAGSTNVTSGASGISGINGIGGIGGISGIPSFTGAAGSTNLASIQAGLAALRTAATDAATQALPASVPASLTTAAGNTTSGPAGLVNLTGTVANTGNTLGIRQATQSPLSMSSATSTLNR